MRDIFSSPGGMNVPESSSNETFDFVKSWLAVSLAFGIFISGGFVFDLGFLINLAIAALTCGVGFVLHELGHRVMARRYGAEAHFMASPDGMLFLPILLAFVGFFIAAPGAVWHRGYLTREQLGHIALAGPVVNLVLALAFFGLVQVTAAAAMPDLLVRTLSIGYHINAWLGLFNMIPVDPFDGAKIIRWSKVGFGITVVVALFLVFVLPGII